MPAAGTRRRRLGGHELVEQLNAAVAALIKENRKLKRQVEKLTARVPARATGTVDRSLRTIQRRVQKALNRAQASVDGSGRARRNSGGELFDLPLQLAILFDESGDRSVQLLDQLMTAQSAAACACCWHLRS